MDDGVSDDLQLVLVPGGAAAVATLERLALPSLREHGFDDKLPELFPEQQLPRFTLLRAPSRACWQGDASNAFCSSSSRSGHDGLVVIRAACCASSLSEQMEQQGGERLLLGSDNGKRTPLRCCGSVSVRELREAAAARSRPRPLHQPLPPTELVPALLPASPAFLQDLAAAIVQHNNSHAAQADAGVARVAPLTLQTVQETAAAVAIQAAWRARAARAQHRASQQALVLRAARCIQTAWRACVLRRQLATLPASGEEAAAESSRGALRPPAAAPCATPPLLLQRIPPTHTLMAAAAAIPSGAEWLAEEQSAAASNRGRLQFRVPRTPRLPHLVSTHAEPQPLRQTLSSGGMPAPPDSTCSAAVGCGDARRCCDTPRLCCSAHHAVVAHRPPAVAAKSGGIVSPGALAEHIKLQQVDAFRAHLASTAAAAAAAAAAMNDTQHRHQNQQHRRQRRKAGGDMCAAGPQPPCSRALEAVSAAVDAVTRAAASNAASAAARAAHPRREQWRADRSQACEPRCPRQMAGREALVICQQAAAARRSVLRQWHGQQQAAAACRVGSLRAARRAARARRLQQQEAATSLAAACHHLGMGVSVFVVASGKQP